METATDDAAASGTGAGVEVPDDSDYLPMDRAPERGCCRDARPVSARRLADVCVAFQEDR